MQTNPAIYADFETFTKLKKDVRDESPEAIKEVARQFESLFVQMMLKSMRDTLPENELFGSNAERMYQDMYDKQLSMQISNSRGIGLAKVIERQLGGEPDLAIDNKLMTDYLRYPRAVEQGVKSAVTLSRLTPDSNRSDPPNSHSSDKPNSTWKSADDFIQDVWPHALRAAETLGVDADVLLAQSALETGWGKHLPLKADGTNSFNLFGIKADQRWQGDKVEINTREYRHGVMQQEKAAFRTYDSVADAFSDYVDFIMLNPRYQQALEHGYDADSYARELQQAGYATDPDYASKINRIRGNEAIQSKVSELKFFNKVPLT